MFTLHDDRGTDPTRIRTIADIDEGFALFDYVSIKQTDNEEWIAQVVVPNLNISTVGDPLNPTILHGLQLSQQRPDIRSIESIQVFSLMILGQVRNGQIITARLRPLPGSVVRRLDSQETIRIIGIPTLSKDLSQSNAIGRLLNAENVPLCITREMLNYHFMVVGGTGSGKSNASANLVAQAVRMDKCVLIHDVKPDYRMLRDPNSETVVNHVWKQVEEYGLVPYGMKDVLHIGFYGLCNPSDVDAVVGFQSSDFNPDLLAALFFGSSGNESLQYDGFAASAHALDELRESGDSRYSRGYTLDDILEEVNRRSTSPPNPQAQIATSTTNAINRKVGTRRRNLPWLDAVGRPAGSTRAASGSAFTTPSQQASVQKFNLAADAKSGRIILIDYGHYDDDAAYALILSWFLREAQTYRKQRRDAPIVQLIDEAHRVFDNRSRHSQTLEREFNRAMREGRSVDHSLILSLQNASQIPPGVMNNLNSKIVMKQNNAMVAKAATQTMGEEFSEQSMRLGVGQALVSLHESKAVVLAQVAPSPFDLMRPDNSSR